MKKKKKYFLSFFTFVICFLIPMNVLGATELSQEEFDAYVYNYMVTRTNGDVYKYNFSFYEEDGYSEPSYSPKVYVNVKNSNQQSVYCVSFSSFKYKLAYAAKWSNGVIVDYGSSLVSSISEVVLDEDGEQALINFSSFVANSNCMISGAINYEWDITDTEYSSDASAFYHGLYLILQGELPPNCEASAFNIDSATYDADLGYVKDVRLTSAYLKLWDETLNEYVYKENAEGELRIQWGATSTSGYDLNTDGTFVRVLTTAQVYDASSSKREGLTSGAFHFKNLVGSVEASKLEYRDTYENMWKASQEDFEKIRDGLGYFNSWVRQDDIHLQIVRYDSTTGQWLYGGYLKIRPTEDGKSLVGVPLTPSGGMSIDSGGTQSISVDKAYGTTYEDAYDNADNGYLSGIFGGGGSSDGGSSGGYDDIWDFLFNGGVTEFVGQLEGFIGLVGKWPSIIANVFSFLPSWCLNFFGFSVALSCLVMLWKVLKG